MLFQESETVELKEAVVDDIKKEIIAFANCDGGKLYIGIRNDGTVAGLDNPDSVSLQISNMVRDAIKPDVTMFLHYKTVKEDGKEIVEVNIQRGTDRPYYLAKKGMRPEGVYVRQGYSSVPATDTAIRRMIKETDGDRFEAMRCINQELTFEAAKKEFMIRKVEFGSQQMRALKLIDQDGLYSNLGLLMSDQCVHTIKVAVFQGTDQTIFKDRREFTGSLMRQMNEVYDFIDFRNQTRATIERLLRIDVRDYPEIAVREALLNLLVHRDYSFSASALISIYADRIEFVSIGGLMPGIDLEDIMIGISVCRNQDLANVFCRLHLIEAYGTGMGKIMRAYEGMEEKPSIETTKNAFKVILPNINAKYETGKFSAPKAESVTSSAVKAEKRMAPTMDRTEKTEILLEKLKADSTEYKGLNTDGYSLVEKKKAIRSLMNIRLPREIPNELADLQDAYLQDERDAKGIVRLADIPTIKEAFHSKSPYAEKISLWQGDITRLKAGAIVNAANSQMLGCFAPCHGCIDNAIHSAAGMRLREECSHIMSQRRLKYGRNYQEPTGTATLTKAYNLPCDYVIHTVGPIVYGQLNGMLCRDLQNCYENVLQCCLKHDIKSVAFCCISTGEFHFPNDKAAEIAWNTVTAFLKKYGDCMERVIFNVFKDSDLKLYERLV